MIINVVTFGVKLACAPIYDISGIFHGTLRQLLFVPILSPWIMLIQNAGHLISTQGGPVLGKVGRVTPGVAVWHARASSQLRGNSTDTLCLGRAERGLQAFGESESVPKDCDPRRRRLHGKKQSLREGRDPHMGNQLQEERPVGTHARDLVGWRGARFAGMQRCDGKKAFLKWSDNIPGLRVSKVYTPHAEFWLLANLHLILSYFLLTTGIVVVMK